MSWNIADYDLLRRIRRLQAQVDFLSSRVGDLTGVIVVGGLNPLMEGPDDPNEAVIIPANPAQPAQYQRVIDGVPIQLYWWHVEDQVWF